jgi:hypothetical protein
MACKLAMIFLSVVLLSLLCNTLEGTLFVKQKSCLFTEKYETDMPRW